MQTEEQMDAQLAGLAEIAAQGEGSLRSACPDLEALGYTLLLGKHYARQPRGILMLGLNPGHSTHTGPDAKRQSANWLLDGLPGVRLRYWANARRLFTHSDALHSAMQEATYGFCCPYRTVRWNGLPRRTTEALMDASAAPLLRMMLDCRPQLVIIAGLESLRVFLKLLHGRVESSEATTSMGGIGSGTYQWHARSATFDGEPFTIAQIPHLSRASSKSRLAECGEWLSGIVTAHGSPVANNDYDSQELS